MNQTRRDFVKKAWVAPTILTLPILPSYARAGSDDVRYNESNDNWNVDLNPKGMYNQGTYQVLPPGGQTYVLRDNWTYIGVYGVDAMLPSGFPALSINGLTNPIIISKVGGG